MKNLITAITAGILMLLFASFGYKYGTGEKLLNALQKQQPRVIQVNETNLFPEGIEYDRTNDRFLLTSLSRGNI
jgi:hypothetical protein